MTQVQVLSPSLISHGALDGQQTSLIPLFCEMGTTVVVLSLLVSISRGNTPGMPRTGPTGATGCLLSGKSSYSGGESSGGSLSQAGPLWEAA